MRTHMDDLRASNTLGPEALFKAAVPASEVLPSHLFYAHRNRVCFKSNLVHGNREQVLCMTLNVEEDKIFSSEVFSDERVAAIIAAALNDAVAREKKKK